MKPKYKGILNKYGQGENQFNEETFRQGITLRDLQPGDLVYLRLSGPYGYTLKCEYVKLEKTALHAIAIGCTKGTCYLSGYLGKPLKVRYTSAYLWGKGDDGQPRCHWFIRGGQCV